MSSSLSTYKPVMIGTSALPTYPFVTSYNSSSIPMDESLQPTYPTTVIISNCGRTQQRHLKCSLTRLKSALNFANARNLPFTVVQILNTAYNLVFNTGSFLEGCKKWNAHLDNEIMWDNFNVENSSSLSDLLSPEISYSLGSFIDFPKDCLFTCIFHSL